MKYLDNFHKSHRKTAKEGWELIRRHRHGKRSVDELSSVTFKIEDAVKFVMEGLLSGAKFVRIHKGQYLSGEETIVWTVADGDGNEMPNPIGTLNDGSPCPPLCPQTDPDPDPGGGEP